MRSAIAFVIFAWVAASARAQADDAYPKQLVDRAPFLPGGALEALSLRGELGVQRLAYELYQPPPTPFDPHTDDSGTTETAYAAGAVEAQASGRVAVAGGLRIDASRSQFQPSTPMTSPMTQWATTYFAQLLIAADGPWDLVASVEDSEESGSTRYGVSAGVAARF